MKQQRSITKELILFSLPLVFSGLLQQLYQWADAFIVGHSGPEGELLLAAIGVTGPITTLLLQCIIGFTLGLSILAGQEFGQGNWDRVRNIHAIFLPIVTIVFLVLTVPVILLAKSLLQLMDTPENILSYACSYLQIVLLGIPFLAVYNFYTSLLRAIGNTKVAFYAVLVSSVLNVVLDIVFVLILPWGIRGAAAATTISQAAMTVFVLRYTAVRYPELLSCSSEKQTDPQLLKDGISFGIPPTLRNSITSFGSLILQNFMNGFGTATVLAVTTAYRVDTIMLLPLFNVGAAISSMTARFHGEGNKAKIRQCMKSGTWLIVLISFLLTVSMYLLGWVFIGFFGVTGEALQLGKEFFRDVCLFYVPFGIAVAFRCVLEGIGDLTFSSVVGVSALVVRIGFSYLLRPWIGGRTIAFAEGISWIFLLVVMSIRVWQKRADLFSPATAQMHGCTDRELQ